ncbi:MAG: TIGR00730 family Rossman fold protein [Candidatus Campbellbacteria bacterium]|nr:TIGR00730 family Rossman fold protein [Candidatus Campbellbacteria bacterium]
MPLLDNKHTFRYTPSKSYNVFGIFFIACKVFIEFFRGMIKLRKIKLASSIFGSARNCLDERYYADTEKLAGKLSKMGYAVVTGGADGIMKFANKGAYVNNSESIGFGISLPHEQKNNEYWTDGMEFHYFFSRKAMLISAAEVYIAFPGGFGTLDELFQVLTFVQTGKINKIPIVLYGREFWAPLDEFIRNQLRDKYKTIGKNDNNLYIILDSVDEVCDYIKQMNIIDMQRRGICC